MKIQAIRVLVEAVRELVETARELVEAVRVLRLWYFCRVRQRMLVEASRVFLEAVIVFVGSTRRFVSP
jgi:hypothetical protein